MASEESVKVLVMIVNKVAFLVAERERVPPAEDVKLELDGGVVLALEAINDVPKASDVVDRSCWVGLAHLTQAECWDFWQLTRRG